MVLPTRETTAPTGATSRALDLVCSQLPRSPPLASASLTPSPGSRPQESPMVPPIPAEDSTQCAAQAIHRFQLQKLANGSKTSSSTSSTMLTTSDHYNNPIQF